MDIFIKFSFVCHGLVYNNFIILDLYQNTSLFKSLRINYN